ncbi:MAG: SemiSWEET transporter [bacterium]|nr:SemiSWEET transporter [bacterium]
MNDPLSILGLVAGCFSTFALAPQAIKIFRTREVDQLSIGMLVLMLVGASLWLVYGVLRADVAIMFANAVAIVFQSYMLTVCITHQVKKKRAQ